SGYPKDVRPVLAQIDARERSGTAHIAPCRPALFESRRWGNRFPCDVAIGDVRVIALRIAAVVPVIVRRTVLAVVVVIIHAADIGRIGINRRGIKEPEIVGVPPPTEMAIVPDMAPMSVAPVP